jgi:site-specific recombinase XerD
MEPGTFDNPKIERRRNTPRAYLRCIRNLEVAFGRKYLDEITPEMIRGFKQVPIERQRSPATINRDLSCLRQIFGIAVKEELIQKSSVLQRASGVLA